MHGSAQGFCRLSTALLPNFLVKLATVPQTVQFKTVAMSQRKVEGGKNLERVSRTSQKRDEEDFAESRTVHNIK